MKRSTIITLVLFGALLAGWMVMSRRPDKGEGAHLVSPRIKVALADMDKLEITRPGKPPVVLEKTSKGAEGAPAGKWKMVKPVQYEADSFPMRALVEKLADLDLGDIVTTNTQRHGEFDLGDDKAVLLTISGGGQEKGKLLVGKATGPSTMTRLPGKPEVYGTGGFIRSLVDKEPTVWRSKIITDVKREELAEVTVKTAAGQVVLAAKDEAAAPAAAPPEPTTGDKPATKKPAKRSWSVKESPVPIEKPDEQLIASVAAGMSNLRANDFADDKKAEEVGLTTPRSEVTAKLKDGKTITLLVGNKTDKDESYVQVKDRPQVFIVKNWSVDRYLTSPRNFGDKTVLSFSADELLAIELKGVEGGDVEVTREGVNWRMAKPKAGTIADATKMKAMAAALSRLTAAAYVEDASAKTGLDKSTREVVVKLKGDKTHTVKIGDPVDAKPNSDVYAQVVGQKDVVRLRGFNVKSLMKKGSELEQGAAPPARPPGHPGMGPGGPHGAAGPHGGGGSRAEQRAKLMKALQQQRAAGGGPTVPR